MKKLRGSLLLLLTAVIWGLTFVAQSDAMSYIGPFAFNCFRCAIGSIVLFPFVGLFGRRNALKKRKPDTNIDAEAAIKTRKMLWKAGLLCGTALFAASGLQQFGIALGDSVGKAGFVTSFYIILVPFFGIFLKKRAPLIVWISAAIAVAGLYLLCVKEGFSIELSDLLYIGCAACFAVHILIVSTYSPFVNGVALSCIQFAVSAVLSGICMLIFEHGLNPSHIKAALVPLLYAGVLACGVAYTLQILGQKELDPTVASLIMCLESVFSVIAGWIMLDQRLSQRELIGCGIMLAATILAQLPIEFRNSKKANE